MKVYFSLLIKVIESGDNLQVKYIEGIGSASSIATMIDEL
jgi:hypothetical protein